MAKNLLKVFAISSVIVWVAPDMTKAPALLLDATVKIYVVEQESIYGFLKTSY